MIIEIVIELNRSKAQEGLKKFQELTYPADNVNKAIRKLITEMELFLMKSNKNEYPPIFLWLNVSVPSLI
jgi:hypothetical protein